MTDGSLLEAYYLSDDPDEVLAAAAAVREQSHGEVRKPELVYVRTGKPERDGLLCAKIFGPIEDHRCLCGKLAGREHAGEQCDRCGVLCGERALRGQRWAHIDATVPLLHPMLAQRIASLLGLSERSLSRVARGSANLRDDGTLVLAKRSEFGGVHFDDPDEDEARDRRGLTRIRQRLAALDAEHAALMPELVPVPPAAWRGGQRDAQDTAFMRLVNRRNRYVRLIELDAPPIILDNEQRLLFDRYRALMKVLRRELSARKAPAPRARDADREAALLAAIRERPAEDEPRAVYADFLLAHGDPRGEFISMQLENKHAARLSKVESELLRRHFEQWMGPLGQAAARDGHVVFRRGFPVSIKVDDKAAAEVIGEAAWATLEHVESGSAELLADPSLRALERISTNFRTLRALAKDEARLGGVRSALVRMRSTPPPGHSSVVEGDVLPALRELTLLSSGYRAEEDWSWLDGAKLTKQLEALTLASNSDHLEEVRLDDWLAFLSRHRQLRTLCLTFDRKALCFDITPPGEDGLAELTITAAAKFIEYTSIIDELPDRLARPLLSCDPRRWRALRFEAPDYYLSDSLVDALRRVGEHFGDKARLPELREVAEARSAEVAG